MFRTVIYTKDETQRREVVKEMYKQISEVINCECIKYGFYDIETPLFKVDIYNFRRLNAERGRRCDMIVIDDELKLSDEDVEFANHITHLNENRFKMCKYSRFKILPFEKFVNVENSIDNGWSFYRD